MTVSQAKQLGGIPLDDDGPVFQEPWQAEIFAMTLSLYESAVFTWPEWANALSHQRRQSKNDDDGNGYYLDWLAALEKLTADKGVTDRYLLLARKQAWAKAAAGTPHGQPIVLNNT